jgi:hypothetical protein
MNLSSVSKVKSDPTSPKSSPFSAAAAACAPPKAAFLVHGFSKRKGMACHVNNSKILMVGAPLVQPGTVLQ